MIKFTDKLYVVKNKIRYNEILKELANDKDYKYSFFIKQWEKLEIEYPVLIQIYVEYADSECIGFSFNEIKLRIFNKKDILNKLIQGE